jgi:hypothetical protein
MVRITSLRDKIAYTIDGFRVKIDMQAKRVGAGWGTMYPLFRVRIKLSVPLFPRSPINSTPRLMQRSPNILSPNLIQNSRS